MPEGHACGCGLGLDIDLAYNVQQLLFPKTSPVCDWCCIGTRNRMAQGLGGDFFDFITLPGGDQALFIGDVTGHGLHASLVMALLYGFIHRASAHPTTPLELVRQANDFLQSFAERSREFDHYFSASLFCGVINPESLEMSYVNAGHPAPLIRRAEELLSLEATAPPIGFFDDPEMGMASFSFRRDDRLLLYTDGITEANDPAGAFFGREGLEEALRETRSDPLQFLEDLFLRLRDFERNAAPRDDCTAIVVDFPGRSSKAESRGEGKAGRRGAGKTED